jgi:hypothetical protein
MSTPVNDLLNALKELDLNNAFRIFVPSLQKDIKFKQLTTEQLKGLLKTLVDSPIYNSQFITSFNKIIKDNCLEESVDVGNLTVYDKLLILFKFRVESVSPEFTISFTEEEVREHNLSFSEKIINLEDHLNSFLKKQYNFLEENIEQDSYSLVCQLPTLDTENRLEEELHKNIKIEVQSPEELREIVGETFINELTKYISKVTVGSTSLDLLTTDFKTRIKIVEQLPTSTINKVLKFIENYRQKTKELTTLNINGLQKDLPQDASLFNI